MKASMKAIVYEKYGSPDVLHLQEVDKPVPQDHQVLIKNRATTVTAGDCENRAFKIPLWARPFAGLMLGFRKPKRPILGMELAGEVVAVGKDVIQFKEGDPVFAATPWGFGAHAEYVCVPATNNWPVAIKPANTTFAEAAAVPTGALNALRLLQKATIQPGQKVLINGAAGSIGTFAVQLAKVWGAEITAVDHPDKLAVLPSLGADHVIAYTTEDFTQNGETYDVILDTVGSTSFSPALQSLNKNGFYLVAHPGLSHLLRGPWTSRSSSKTVVTEFAKYSAAQLIFLKELLEAGKLKAVIDRTYPFEKIPEAHGYVETGRKIGNVAITVEELL